MLIKSFLHLLLALILALGALGLVDYKNRSGFSKNTIIDSASSSLQLRQPLDVEVIGKKFQWDFRYPGRDGMLNTADDVYSERKLVLPPNKDVVFHITSEDYVYILGIPLNENGSRNVKKRQIAVPDLTHFIEYQFTHPGVYDLMVDPLCGFQSLHDPKMGEIVITNEHAFQELFPNEIEQQLGPDK